MTTKTKEILKIVAFVVVPFASAVAVIHYAPKIKEWNEKRKEQKELSDNSDKKK